MSVECPVIPIVLSQIRPNVIKLHCSDDIYRLNALLTLIGAKDDWASASRCDETHSQAKSDYAVDLQIYPEAYHVFDLEGIDQQQLGHTLRYNADAASDAIMRVQQFLGQNLH